jgi:hypothetical protein
VADGGLSRKRRRNVTHDSADEGDYEVVEVRQARSQLRHDNVSC